MHDYTVTIYVRGKLPQHIGIQADSFTAAFACVQREISKPDVWGFMIDLDEDPE